MPLRIAEKTLERLEWPRLRERLAALARTPGGRAHCLEGDLFHEDGEAVREALAETAEAAALLGAGADVPLGGIRELGPIFRRLGKGGVLEARELLDLAGTLHAFHATERFFEQHGETAPRLARRANGIVPQRDLAEEIDHCIDAEGQVKDSASRALREARSEVRSLSGELERRLDRYLQDPDVKAALSDRFFTMRNDRYVLPVRADSRGAVRGIVHDASGSGTTLFIEPEAVVELNNRLKSAELTIERECLRVLRELSERAGRAAGEIRESLGVLEALDAIGCRARLAEALDAVEPEVGDEGIVRLPLLRHPLIDPEEVVPSDLAVGEHYQVLVISGPNAGGKTVGMKALGLAALLTHAGCFVPCAAGARVDVLQRIVADIGDEQDIRESLSTFSAHMANLAEIVAGAGPGTLVVLDEIGQGTDPSEGAALAQAILEGLADAGARVVATTHFNLLKEMAEVDSRFENASVEFHPETLAPTYRLHTGTPGASSATAVASRMGLRADVLERANALLEREDRRLDRMLSELAASRVTLDAEQREARRLRDESEAARAEYRAKLERLQERRDQLFESMKTDLEGAFRDAHGQVAAVIRDLQRGGTARDAAHARERLLGLEDRAREAEREVEARTPASEPRGTPMDWQRAKPGAAVDVVGVGAGTLDSLPDRRGRVAVHVGTTRVVVPAERVHAAPGTAPARRRPADAVTAPTLAGGTTHCDLRGMRVEQALDEVEQVLDRAAGDGRDRVSIVHGKGTGALRDAIRSYLSRSPYVVRSTPGAAEEGGDGVTLVDLRD